MRYPAECPVFEVLPSYAHIEGVKEYFPDRIVQCTIDEIGWLRIDTGPDGNYGFAPSAGLIPSLDAASTTRPRTRAAREMLALVTR